MFVSQRYQHRLLGIMHNPESPFALTPVGTHREQSGKAVCQPWETWHERPAHLDTLANSDDVFEGNRDPALVEGTESVKPRYLNNEIIADHRDCRHERIIPAVPMDSLSPSRPGCAQAGAQQPSYGAQALVPDCAYSFAKA